MKLMDVDMHCRHAITSNSITRLPGHYSKQDNPSYCTHYSLVYYVWCTFAKTHMHFTYIARLSTNI